MSLNFELHNIPKNIKYILTLSHKFNIINDDSAVGKTELYRLVRDYADNIGNITCSSSMPILPVPSLYTAEEIARFISTYENTIFVADEDNKLLMDNNFTRVKDILFKSKNIFLFITRKYVDIPLPENAVYKFVNSNSGKTHTMQLWRHQKNDVINTNSSYATIIEDSKSGYQFIKEYSEHYNKEMHIFSSHGVSNLISKIEELHSMGYSKFNIIYDYIGSGSQVRKLITVIQKCLGATFNIIDWYSFEYYLLSSENLVDFLSEAGQIISSLSIINKEEELRKLLSVSLKYQKNKYLESCFTLKKHCGSCPLFSNCHYSVNNRADIYIHTNLISFKEKIGRKTSFFS